MFILIINLFNLCYGTEEILEESKEAFGINDFLSESEQYIEDAFPDLDIGKLDAYIQRFQKFHVQKIDISGGEPLQYLYLKKVCTGLYENNIYMTLTTRGVGSEDNLQWLLENGHMFSRIIISLDAGERELQQLLAGSQEVERTMPLIEELSKRYPDILRINTVVTKYLLQKEHIENNCKPARLSRTKLPIPNQF